jgi:trimeric autotransporter adhesin
MANRVLLTLIIVLGLSNLTFAAPLTFDWNGTGTSWTTSSSWTETGGTGDYPGSAGRTTDIVRFGVTGSTYTNQPTLTTSLTIASIEFGGGIQKNGTAITVTGVTLTVGTITQDINTTSASNTIFDYLQGTGTVSASSITVGNGTTTTGTFNFLLSDVATLNVSGNVTIISNVNKQNGSGFRLEAGNMYLAGQVIFTTLTGITASNASYFTVNTVAQAGGNTTPHLYLSNANPLPSIPTPKASVNFYGDRGGTGTVTYTAASPVIYTTSTPGFGTGGGTIDTTKSSYDNITIQGTGTATIGTGTTVGALKVTGDLTTASPTVFNSSAATNTSIGGNWINSSTVTGSTGTTAVTGNITNSGTMTLSSGSTDVGGSLNNTATFNAGSGNIQVDGSVSNSSALTLSSGNFTIETNYTNSGTFTAGSGAVNFSSASAQSLADNSTTGTTFNNVNFSGGGTKTMSGTGSFAESSNGVITMGALTTLQTGNILTLNSASTGSATVAAIPSTSSITGTVNVQRYISGGSNAYRGYRFLSSPIYTATSSSNFYYSLAYLANFAPITGTTGTGGGLTKIGNPSMYLYRDNVLFTNLTFNTGNFRGINAINNTPAYSIGIDYDGAFNLHSGTGILFFYRGNLNNIGTKYTTTTAAEANLFVSTGTLNQQAIKVVNWYTGSTSLQYDVIAGNVATYVGYNLVGNPYASSIDWTTYSQLLPTAGIYAPSVNSTIYIYNEVAKVYATYNAGLGTNGGSNVIPSGQGFFVKASSALASLTFNEAAKTNAQVVGPTQSTGSNDLLLGLKTKNNANTTNSIASKLQYLRLELAADTINKEETIVRIDSGAQNGFVVNEDSQYMVGNGEVSLSSFSADNMQLAINDIPLPKSSQTVRLKVKATASGAYAINRTELNNLPALYEVWLMDAYLKDSLDIKHNSAYKFNVNLSDTNSFGANRFSVVIRQDPALMVHLLSFSASKAVTGDLVLWTTENEADYTNFTVQRSINSGKTFDAIGNFTSNNLGTYNYLDRVPVKGVNQYRLMMQDLNGNITYSNVITILYDNMNNTASSPISIYPNPAKGTLNLLITPANSSSAVTTTAAVYGIKIMNTSGTLVKTATTTQQTWQADISNLLPGTYIMQVVNNSNESVIGKGTFIKL